MIYLNPIKRLKSPNDYTTANIYFGEQQELLNRVTKLSDEVRGVSISGLIVTALACCIETFEKNVPTKRKFMCNGKKVVV